MWREIGDQSGEALALTHLGIARRGMATTSRPPSNSNRPLTICREIGARDSEATALTILGVVCWHRGRYQQAAEQLQQALTLSREIGSDPVGQTRALDSLGLVYRRQGHYQQATRRKAGRCGARGCSSALAVAASGSACGRR